MTPPDCDGNALSFTVVAILRAYRYRMNMSFPRNRFLLPVIFPAASFAAATLGGSLLARRAESVTAAPAECIGALCLAHSTPMRHLPCRPGYRRHIQHVGVLRHIASHSAWRRRALAPIRHIRMAGKTLAGLDFMNKRKFMTVARKKLRTRNSPSCRTPKPRDSKAIVLLQQERHNPFLT